MGLNQGELDHLQSRKKSVWLLPGLLLGVTALLAVTGDWGRELLRYDRGAIAAGQVWRLISGHLVHLGWPHFLLNGAGLLLIFYLLGSRFSATQWISIALVTVVGIDIGFWLWQPQLLWYVGLSGVLHGFLAAGAIAGLRTGQLDYWLIAAFLLIKLGYEQFFGPLPGSEDSTGGNVVVASHLYGAVAGALIGSFLTFRKARAAAI